MSDVTIPQKLVELQRRVDSAFDALETQRRDLGRPASEWPDEERQRADALLAEATAAAQELRDAITASGLEEKHGSAVLQPKLKQAAQQT